MSQMEGWHSMEQLYSNYVFNYAHAHAFCMAAVAILLYKQLTVFNETAMQKAFTKILFIQPVLVITCMIRFFITTGYLPQNLSLLYAVNILNLGVFAYCSYRIFLYLELYQKTPMLKNPQQRKFLILPLIFNLAMIFSCPATGFYFSIN